MAEPASLLKEIEELFTEHGVKYAVISSGLAFDFQNRLEEYQKARRLLSERGYEFDDLRIQRYDFDIDREIQFFRQIGEDRVTVKLFRNAASSPGPVSRATARVSQLCKWLFAPRCGNDPSEKPETVTGDIPDGKVPVSMIRARGDLNRDVKAAVDLIGGIGKYVSPGQKVLLKPNFNGPFDYPASTDSEMISCVVNILKNHGVVNISLGESSGLGWHPTSNVLKKRGIPELCDKLGIRLILFDEEEWTPIEVDGRYLKQVSIPKSVVEADRLIYLPNLKTHAGARFTMSMKLAVGLTEPSTRKELHKDHVEEKIAEINLAVKPDLIILDGRQCFVTWGPDRGRKKSPGVIMASADPVAMDIEAVRILKSFRARNRLGIPLCELPQIAAATRLKIGVRSTDDYVIVKE